MNTFPMLSEGLLKNILITFLSSILPLGFGILFTFLCSRNHTFSKVSRALSIVFESLCPIVLVICLYFVAFPTSKNALPILVLGFTLCFLGYMPAHYAMERSFLKNTVVNALGLISAVFKWSFCAGMIGYLEMLHSSTVLAGRTFETGSYFIVLLISFVILALLETSKYIANEKL